MDTHIQHIKTVDYEVYYQKHKTGMLESWLSS